MNKDASVKSWRDVLTQEDAKVCNFVAPEDWYKIEEAFQRIEAAVDSRITELEAQVPKVVTPTLKRHTNGSYYLCPCGSVLDGVRRFDFCPDCGSKLSWEEK